MILAWVLNSAVCSMEAYQFLSGSWTSPMLEACKHFYTAFTSSIVSSCEDSFMNCSNWSLASPEVTERCKENKNQPECSFNVRLYTIVLIQLNQP